MPPPVFAATGRAGNFIDIDAREQIEEVLLRDQRTVVFVEHDAAFVDRVATQVLRLPG